MDVLLSALIPYVSRSRSACCAHVHCLTLAPQPKQLKKMVITALKAHEALPREVSLRWRGIETERLTRTESVREARKETERQREGQERARA